MSALKQLVSQAPVPMDDHMECLEAYLNKAKGAYAPNTLRALRQDIEQYVGWCMEVGHVAFPVTTEALIDHIEFCTPVYSRATIERRISHLRKAHQVLGLSDPKDDPDVQLAVERMKRKKGASQGQARALTEREIQKILETTGEGLIDLRDVALLLVARDMMARRSEIVNLLVSDISGNEDGSGTSTIRKSKTDQEGHCAKQWLSQRTMAALEKWLERSGIRHGPIFRAVKKGDLVGGRFSPDDVSRCYKKMAKRAGLSPELISGHSARVGMTQDLCAAGMELTELMVAGRWKSPRMPARYAERMQASRGAVAKFYRQNNVIK